MRGACAVRGVLEGFGGVGGSLWGEGGSVELGGGVLETFGGALWSGWEGPGGV